MTVPFLLGNHCPTRIPIISVAPVSEKKIASAKKTSHSASFTKIVAIKMPNTTETDMKITARLRTLFAFAILRENRN